MFDSRPIGIFDSGLGGLTAMRALMHALPHENICYLGDTGRVPYGGRSRDTILRYTLEDIAFLKGLDVKAIVVACGTASAVALPFIAPQADLPIYGVLSPAVAAAVAATKRGNIGIIGTEATIQSGAYETLLNQARQGLRLTSIACPLFVPLVENGRIHPGDLVIETVVREYLAPFKSAGIDTLILGCTHYPLLEEVIRAYLGAEIRLISAGAEAATLVANALDTQGLLHTQQSPGKKRFFVTDHVGGFERLASLFLGENIIGEVSQVRLGAQE